MPLTFAETPLYYKDSQGNYHRVLSGADMTGYRTASAQDVIDAAQDADIASRAKTDEIGIVINGSRPSMVVTAGQYVIVRGSTITGITDGLYTAVNALSPSTDVTAADLTAVTVGGLNSIPKWQFALSTAVVGATVPANGFVDVILSDVAMPSSFIFVAHGDFGEGCLLRNSWVENGQIKITIANYLSSIQTLPSWAAVKILYQAT